MHSALLRRTASAFGALAALALLGGCPANLPDETWPAVYGTNVTYVNQNKAGFEDDAAQTRTTPPGSEGQQIPAASLVGCWGSYDADFSDNGSSQTLAQVTEALKFEANGNVTHWVILEYTTSTRVLQRQAFRFRGTYSTPVAGRVRLEIADVDAVNPQTGEWELFREDLNEVRDWPATLEQGRLIVSVGVDAGTEDDPVYWTTFRKFDCQE
jgi:hypothetical protein